MTALQDSFGPTIPEPYHREDFPMSLSCKLAAWIAIGSTIATAAAMASPLGGDGFVAPLSDEESWKLLPPTETARGQPLPSWSRMLAKSLPRTTAALLELDLAQRTKGPLDPKLRASMRWVAAHASHSPYGEAYAAFDARRARLDAAR